LADRQVHGLGDRVVEQGLFVFGRLTQHFLDRGKRILKSAHIRQPADLIQEKLPLAALDAELLLDPQLLELGLALGFLLFAPVHGHGGQTIAHLLGGVQQLRRL
jgi:hypothetical protein